MRRRRRSGVELQSLLYISKKFYHPVSIAAPAVCLWFCTATENELFGHSHISSDSPPSWVKSRRRCQGIKIYIVTVSSSASIAKGRATSPNNNNNYWWNYIEKRSVLVASFPWSNSILLWTIETHQRIRWTISWISSSEPCSRAELIVLPTQWVFFYQLPTCPVCVLVCLWTYMVNHFPSCASILLWGGWVLYNQRKVNVGSKKLVISWRRRFYFPCSAVW